MTREERKEKLNAALSDAEMAAATGGVATDAGDQPEPKFKVGDRFNDLPSVTDGYVTGIYKYVPQIGWWYYNVHVLDKDGWYDDIWEEINMNPI